jgi:hypothetical protein
MNAPVHCGPNREAWTKPLDHLDVSDPGLYQNDTWYPYFERLRGKPRSITAGTVNRPILVSHEI